MNLTLIIPPNDFLDEETFVPPLGLLYVAMALKNKFKNIKIIPWERFKQIIYLLDERVDVVGLTGSSVHEKYFKELSKMISSSIIKIAGGPLATIASERIRDYGYIVVKGEVEAITNELMNAISKKKNKIIEGCDKFDMDIYDNVDFSLVEKYYDLHKRIGLMTSRGCIYNCAFCAKTIKRLKLRSIDNVYLEIKQLKEKYNPELFIFYDDNILINRRRFISLSKRIEDLKIKWRSQARTDFVNDEIIFYAKRSGCIQLSFGIESGSQKILDIVNKKNTTERNSKAIQICKKVGIKTKAFIMLGLPGESQETIEKTKRWVLESHPDIASLYIFYPFEGCDIYNNQQKYDIHFNKDTLGYYAGKKQYSPCIVKTSFLSSKEILKAKNNLQKTFEDAGIKVY